MLANDHSEMLSLNVGHMVGMSVGFSREMSFSGAEVTVASDLMLARLVGDAKLTRTPPGILVEGTINAVRDMECVRCLTVYAMPTEVSISELYTYPPEAEAEWMISEDYILNLAPLLREQLLVEEPIQALCRLDCKGLCHNCGQDWNLSGCACLRESNDARFAVLQELLEVD